MSTGSEFPMFITAEYVRDGAGFPEFERQAADSAGRARRAFDSAFAGSADSARKQFESAFNDVGRIAREALSVERNGGGSLDLNIKQYQQSAQAARASAIATREVANAMDRAAKAEGDYSEATRLAIQAARAQAIETDREARSLETKVAALEKVQRELNRTASATTMVVQGQGRYNDGLFRGNDGLRAQRLALVQTGQQLQDFTVSLSSGQKLSTVLIQQLPQLAFAMQGFGGKVGAAAEKLSGPLGFGLISAIALLAEFAPALFGASDASDNLAERQKNLASYLDETTGKIKEQVGALALLAKARDLEKEQKANLARYDQQRGRVAETIVKAFQPVEVVDPVYGAREMPTALSGDSRSREQALGFLREYQQGLINIATLQQRIDAMARSNPALKGLANDLLTVSDNTQAAALAVKGNVIEQARLAVATNTATEAQRRLVNASTQQNVNIARQIELESQLSTATTDVERARARLEQVKLRGAGIDKKGADAQKQYRQDLDAANIALNKAEAAEKAAREAKAAHNRATREASALANAQATAQERIAKISSQFDVAPRFADQQASALRYLDETIDKYGKLNDAKSKQLVLDARAAKATVETGRDTKFQQFLDDQKESLEIQALRNAGYDAEATALEQINQLENSIGQLSSEHKDQVLAGARAYEQQQIAAEKMRTIIQDYVGLIDGAQSAFERLLGKTARLQNPFKSLSGFGSDLVSTFIDTNIRVISDKMFGGVAKQLEDFVNPQHALATETTGAAVAVANFANSLVNATARLNSSTSLTTSFGLGANLPMTGNPEDFASGLRDIAFNALSDARDVLGIEDAANDNGEIVVTAKKQLDAQQQTIAAIDRVAPSVGQALDFTLGKSGLFGAQIFGPIQAGMAEVLNPLGDLLNKGVKGLTGKIDKIFGGKGGPGGTGGPLVSAGQALAGAGIGVTAASLTESIFGGKGSKLGGAIGGAVGQAAGKALGSALGSLGAAGGPLGAIAGGILGSALGGVLKKTKKGSTTLGYDTTTGEFTTSVTGNSESRKRASSQAGDSVTGTLQRIADAFGGVLGNFAVSIGVRDDKYRVDTTGAGRTKKGAGVLDFGSDQAGAIKAAIVDAIRDGAIKYLRPGTQKLLTGNDDLEVALDKAGKFQGVFDTLKQITDPVGFAIEQLDRQFEGLQRIFKEAGATTEEYADLEKLYSLQRAEAIKQAAQSMRSSLQSLLDDLKFGESGGLSLQDRLNNALSAYNPLAQRVAAGDQTVDYDAFTEAARTVQDLARQLYGSQDGFFDIVDNMRSLTEKALADQQALIDIATGAQTPFDASTPTPGQPTNDNTPVVQGLTSVEEAIAALSGLTGSKLDALISAVRGLVPASGAAAGAGFAFQRQNF